MSDNLKSITDKFDKESRPYVLFTPAENQVDAVVNTNIISFGSKETDGHKEFLKHINLPL